MQAVILAAGRGSRLGPHTNETPKTLVGVGGKAIIEHILENLPEEITEVVIVIKYLGFKIKEKIGSSFGNKKIIYIEQGDISGTYGALFSAKEVLKNNFLVLSGDDIISKEDISLMLKGGLSFGVSLKNIPSLNYLIIETENDFILDFKKPKEDDLLKPQYMATSTYVLNQDFWNYEKVLIGGGEYGLPQTIKKMCKEHRFKAVDLSSWVQINTSEDLEKANKIINEKI
jgi:bifunctional UDP-N-acetylglucosamine pyrophosphorylase/glucosamine-1-phosphate N-acetyltransferase